MSLQKLQTRLTRIGTGLGDWLFVRIAIGAALAGGFISGMKAVFLKLAETDDWVLEYSYWLTAGFCVIGLGILIGFVPVTRPNQPNG
jgi:hypothetical protein